MTSQEKEKDSESSLARPNVIDRFRGDYKFLSNFQASTFFYQGKKYASVEHVYQAMKSNDPDEQEKIRNAIAPSQAKKMGKSVVIRDDWETVKVPLMKEFLKLKFQNPFLRHRLLATKHAILIEGNTWHDVVWGQCKCNKCGGQGQNLLGKLLMEVRAEAYFEEDSDMKSMQGIDET